IAMIGGDDERAARLLDGFGETPEAGIDGFDCFHSGVELAGMPDHVGVGVIQNHDIKPAGTDRRYDFVRDLARGHLGLLTVRRDLWRRHQDALLAREYGLAAAIKEECDVRVFLSFGDAQLRHTGIRYDLA